MYKLQEKLQLYFETFPNSGVAGNFRSPPPQTKTFKFFIFESSSIH